MKTLMRPGTHKLDLQVRWDLWSITKRLIRNRSLNPSRDREYYHVARGLSAASSSTPDLGGYRLLFAPARGKLTGDIAPAYASLSADFIRDCRSVLQDARLFMIARDPVDRFWSAMSRYRMYRTFGDVDYGSLETAQRLFMDPERRQQHFPTEILSRWQEGMGADAMKIFYFDDVVDRPKAAFADMMTYIGSNTRDRLPFVPVSYNRKASAERVKPAQDAREWVRTAFQDELERCVDRFGSYGQRWFEKHRAGREGGAGHAG